jgi:pimeloyl-ACP methyl ester carboxylesterase
MRAVRAVAAAALVLIVASCGGGPIEPTPSPDPTPTSTPAPTTAPSLPVAILTPAMTAEELFDDDIPASQLNLQERSRQPRDRAVIRDVRFTGADGQPVPAYLVAPTSGRVRAGVVFLHWLGDDFSSRDEFVDEAVELAGHGVESMLITQHFPWAERPLGVDHDRVAIGLQVRSIRRALTLLAEEVRGSRIAIAGHDYGAMYGILAASVEDRVAALAGMTPDSTWVAWFVKYFHVVPESDAAGYAQAMADLDPISRIPGVTAPIMLQFGTADAYVSAEDATALANAAPGGTLLHSYDAGHRLNGQARDDRDGWLLQELRVPVPTASP